MVLPQVLMITASFHADEDRDYYAAAEFILQKYNFTPRAPHWYFIGEHGVREEFMRAWWIEFGGIIMVPDYDIFGTGDERIRLAWRDDDPNFVLFSLRWL